jgi:hypothetical protein
MRFPRRQFLRLTAGAAAVSRVARAQTYPARPITIVVPFPAGGALDVFGRILAERMRASLAQNVIIENIAGASGGLRGRHRRLRWCGSAPFRHFGQNCLTQKSTGNSYERRRS